MPDARTAAVEVFCAYASEDEDWFKRLEKHLSLLQRQGLISLWHERKLLAGSDWQREIDARLESAAIILLLVSADFFASDYCSGVEMTRARARHDAREARVIPILLRSCDWQVSPLAHLHPLPSGGKFITKWSDKDAALTEVATSIRLALADLSLLTASRPGAAGQPRWNVPFARNLFFSGREAELAQLHTRLRQSNTAAIGQAEAISGLGGIGKTQLAVEYAYRHRADYHAILWVRADSLETLNASYADIAILLNLPERHAREQERIVQAVRTWLEMQQDWLLILDNLDEPAALFPLDEQGQLHQRSPFLPLTHSGHLLVTTRAADLSALALGLGHSLAVETLMPAQGARLLLRRAGLLSLDAESASAVPQDLALATQISRELGGLPLALDQAGAYLSATRIGLAAYLNLFQQRHADLLKQHRNNNYPRTVATTWTLSFERVQVRNPAAADLLRFCAFLAPDDIPEEIFTKGADILGPILAPITSDPLQFNEAIEALRAYSLIARDAQTRTLTVHRLVQTVLRDTLPAEAQQQWMQRAVNAVEATYPGSDFDHWPLLDRLLPHMLICAIWIEHMSLATPEAARLLNQAGYYLDDRARYVEAGPLYRRALTIHEQVLGPEHPDTATSLNNLALLYKNQGKYEQAEPLYQRTLAIDEKAYGLEHPEVAIDLNNLALLYMDQGKYEQAESLYQRALTICEQALGAEHPNTRIARENYAGLLRRMGRG